MSGIINYKQAAFPILVVQELRHLEVDLYLGSFISSDNQLRDRIVVCVLKYVL